MDALYYVALGSALMLILGYLKSRYFGFMAQRPEDYAADTGTVFDLRTHLNGPLICEGVIYGPTGRVTSRFVGEFEATWNGNQGVMHEHFTYESGSEQHREWNLTLGNDGRIRATAPDVVGEGEGQQSGAAVQLRYRIRLPEDAGGHVLDTTDWMYLAPNGTIVNRSQFRKFGIKVAELVATMRRKEEVA
ncbi:DUF3833 domain-containing protein [Maliponia aquimaris]|jgi:hypothetical protein|uniref:DUF3833 domain-containing protein n=1 Tax=Maliponia aquimaris TaxID=1673631 RepID=A0A238KBF9_9RHOB|nr:DUF3833 domain-containing protein [Maliponia aquimaris]SMX39346.1 hypothetical protein MAA8898_01987 [Maliponia aquimaris]